MVGDGTHPGHRRDRRRRPRSPPRRRPRRRRAARPVAAARPTSSGAHALIIRSATQVTAEVLEAGADLLVVGRAGIGLDNVDVDAATRRGVMVVNAPQSNIISAAEHTMALLLAQARNVPQAHAALIAGRWERSRWEGVELADKTLGDRRSRPHRQARGRPRRGVRRCGWWPTTRSCRPTGPARWASSCCRSTRWWPRPTSSRSTCRRPRRPPASSTAICC